MHHNPIGDARITGHVLLREGKRNAVYYWSVEELVRESATGSAWSTPSPNSKPPA